MNSSLQGSSFTLWRSLLILSSLPQFSYFPSSSNPRKIMERNILFTAVFLLEGQNVYEGLHTGVLCMLR